MILFLTHFFQNSSPLCRREQKLETGEEREDDNAAASSIHNFQEEEDEEEVRPKAQYYSTELLASEATHNSHTHTHNITNGLSLSSYYYSLCAPSRALFSSSFTTYVLAAVAETSTSTVVLYYCQQFNTKLKQVDVTPTTIYL